MEWSDMFTQDLFHLINKNNMLFPWYSWNIFDRVCGVMVLNTTFNSISVISWRSVLLMEESWVPEENHWPAASQWQTITYIYCIEYTSPLSGFKFQTHVVIGTDYICSCKSNYLMITIATTPGLILMLQLLCRILHILFVLLLICFTRISFSE